jgi:hypothetical protein
MTDIEKIKFFISVFEVLKKLKALILIKQGFLLFISIVTINQKFTESIEIGNGIEIISSFSSS